MKGALTRRDFLRVSGTGAAGMALLGTAGCGRLAKMPENYLPQGGPSMNVVVVIIDSLRRDHVGAHGNPWIKTPNLDALAKESLRFDRALPESIPTIPARRAIHTGLRTFPFRNWDPPEDSPPIYGWQPIPREQATLAETLREEGYETLFITDVQHQFKPSYNFHRGFNWYHFVRGQEKDSLEPYWRCPPEKLERALLGGWRQAKQVTVLQQHLANTLGRGEAEEDWCAPQVFLRSMELLKGAVERQPFFMVVDCFDPHEPWDPPKKYVDLYDDHYDGPEPWITSYGSTDYLSRRELERMRALYAGEVTMVDRWLGNFLQKMSDLGLMEKTLLVLLSDHGHALGEHGIAGKVPWEIYPELVDTVFFIRHPEGKGAGQASDYYASTHDVAPTVLGAMGIKPPQPMDGQNLLVLADGGEPEPRPYFTLGYDRYVWAKDDDYVLVCRNDGAKARLHDLKADPEQNADVAGDLPEVVGSMWNDYVLKDAGGPLPRY